MTNRELQNALLIAAETQKRKFQSRQEVTSKQLPNGSFSTPTSVGMRHQYKFILWGKVKCISSTAKPKDEAKFESSGSEASMQ
ncbi:hypothetical protein V6N12_064641 [Hibiscus sabdariffa]|uniref:Uncharacterized protein n=1 Tax=Hibiscus sabdariffa TaxID=183260 RepID=A0ABR2G6D3_9ROSI